MATRQVALISAFALLLGVFLARLPVTIAAMSAADDWPAAMTEVRRLIADRYVEPVDEDKLIQDGIHGMTESLNDPYTEFVPPADREAFEKDLTGQFVGIGATINTRDQWLSIVYPLEDSPALRAGLRPGDLVKTIDGQTTFEKSPDDCIARIKGPAGTPVTLQIERQENGETRTIEVTLKRAEINSRSAKGYRFDIERARWDHVIDPERAIAYVRLTQFTPGTAQQLKAAIRAAAPKNAPTSQPRGLILDLRDNPGGLLDEAIDVVSLFLDQGIIVSTKGRGARQEFTRAKAGAPFRDLPIVVLVNDSSASASEVVAGALADNNRALIVGTRSFGKGIVQRVEPLRTLPGAQLKLTEQRYYLPSGRLLHRSDDSKVWGVDPSPGFYAPLTDEQRLATLKARRAMETIRPAGAPAEGGYTFETQPSAPIYGPNARWTDPHWLREELGERQLALALDALQQRLRGTDWPAPAADAPTPSQQASVMASTEIMRLERARERFLREASRFERRIIALQDGDLAAANAKRPTPPSDLWPDSINVTGGKLTVTDKEGHAVATLDITGPDLERWLLDADVKPDFAAPPASPARTAAPPTTDKPPPHQDAPKRP